MGNVDRITTKAGTVRWRARWRDPDGIQRAKNFDRKVDAEKHLVNVEHSMYTSTYIDPRAGDVLLKDYAERWRQNQVQHRPRTAALVKYRLENHLYPALGNRKLSSILRSDVQAWVTQLSEHLAPSTVEGTYSHLATMLKSATRDRLIVRSPCEHINLPKRVMERVVPLSRQEVDQIVAAMPDRYRAWVILIATTGLRQSEASGLTVDRVNGVRRMLRIDRQWNDHGFGPPKTDTSSREVPIPGTAMGALGDHMKLFPPLDPEGFIFHTGRRPLSRARVSEIWTNAIANTAITREAHPHDLRHFYASTLIHAGCSVKEVQERLGHKDAGTTLNVYGHLFPDAEERTRAAVDAMFEKALGDTVESEP